MEHEAFTGVLERIIYANEENHYCVGELTLGKGKDKVTIAGVLPNVQCGETLEVSGEWQRHKTHGRQFKVSRFNSKLPQSVWGIRRYLGSGLVPGIGPKYADKIVDHFGVETLEIIGSDSGRLVEVEGIGKGRSRSIKEAWDAQQSVREVMVFLQAYGITNSQCVRLVKKYGNDVLEILKKNPYRIIRDIDRVGFKTADQIARNMGLGNEHPFRLEAGIEHVIREQEKEGHTLVEQERLIALATRTLEVPPEKISQRIQQLTAKGQFLCRTGDEGIQVSRVANQEKEIVRCLEQLRTTPSSLPSIKIPKAVIWSQEQAGFEFAAQQSAAIEMALSAKVSILTGGPGTGKTTILRAVVNILEAKRCRILLTSPTGRAAQRLAESCDHPASTLHRLLKNDPNTGGFVHNQDNPLPADYIVVDEASMLDTSLAASLLRAVPAQAHLLLVGDTDQLPSVGAGHILHDFLETPAEFIPRTKLDIIFRQGKTSSIVTTAHAILAGKAALPHTANLASEIDWSSDFNFVTAENPTATAKKLLMLNRDILPKQLRVDPVQDIQVMAPMYRGEAGIQAFNESLQECLNPEGTKTSQQNVEANQVWTQRHFRESTGRPQAKVIRHSGRTFREGDKVIQMKNNYDKDVFNGDVGIVEGVAPDGDTLIVRFNNERVTYDRGELSELDHAYAISIHKSQGSEYPIVIVPILKQHFVMLQRNLIYTAITRARKRVFVIGDPEAWKIAVDRVQTEERRTGLSWFLKEGFVENETE